MRGCVSDLLLSISAAHWLDSFGHIIAVFWLAQSEKWVISWSKCIEAAIMMYFFSEFCVICVILSYLLTHCKVHCTHPSPLISDSQCCPPPWPSSPLPASSPDRSAEEWPSCPSMTLLLLSPCPMELSTWESLWASLLLVGVNYAPKCPHQLMFLFQFTRPAPSNTRTLESCMTRNGGTKITIEKDVCHQ